MRKLKSLWTFAIVSLSALTLGACVGRPVGVEPVTDFDVSRYLGTWYEIARLDHSFERGLENITAEYSLREDGGVSVLNRGYSVADGDWKSAEGKAYFVGPSDEGHLKVSFFGPFYGSYIVFHLDQADYRYAFISGPDTSYLWLLSRTPTVAPEVLQKFTRMAAARGFDSDQLIYVKHERRHSN